MNLELFIAKKIHFTKNANDNRKKSETSVRIAIIGIALGLAVMIVAVAIVIGFKSEVQKKVIGFGSHIQVTSLNNNTTYETPPITFPPSLIKEIQKTNGVKHTQRFCTKPGIIKTENDFQGIIIKGIDKDFDWKFFSQNLVAGEVFQVNDSTTNNDVIISKEIADLLHLKVNDKFLTYFIEDNIRVRKFNIKGIYNSNFSEFDKLFVIADMKHIQKLNGWKENEITGIEILVNDYNKLDEVTDAIFSKTANRFEENGNTYYTRSIKQLQPQIFSWLELLNMNVWVILILMLTVAGFSIISGLLILILEKTNMIGILKAMGAKNWSIRKVFLYQACFLVGKGMFWGNVLGITICLLQKYLHIIHLDPATYYVNTVPINLSILSLIALNLLTGIFSLLILLVPSHMIAKISPAKSIRFE